MALRAILYAGGLWLTLLGHALLAAPQTGPAATRRSIREGIYSVEQAKRGEMQYDEHCASCHQFDLHGDGLDIPALADDRFIDVWEGRSLRRLFDVIATSMPQQAPGTLAPAVYADILAYILQKNRFPAGATPLDADSGTLEALVLEPPH